MWHNCRREPVYLIAALTQRESLYGLSVFYVEGQRGGVPQGARAARSLRSRNLRQIADALAKGKLAITIVLGRSEYTPFLNAGLPIKEAPTPKEGLPASSGYGVLGTVKNAPHPNTVKVLVNWFWARKDRSFMPES